MMRLYVAALLTLVLLSPMATLWADPAAPAITPSPPLSNAAKLPANTMPALTLPLPMTPETENRPVHRAEWLVWLMQVTNLQNVFVSEFPYFRDVSTQHPAYLAIESTRTKGWLDYWQINAGYFKPDDPVTRLDALTTLGFSFQPSWFKRSLEDTQHLLSPYALQIEGKTSAIQQLALAHCIDSEFVPKSPQTETYLSQPLTLTEANSWLLKRQLLEQEQSPTLVTKVIPAGLTLSVTPTTALYAQQLTVGQYAYFAVEEDLPLAVAPTVIPRGARLRGVVNQASTDFRSVTVGFDKLILPSGESYLMAASLPLSFEPMKLPAVDDQGKPKVSLFKRLLGRGEPKAPKEPKPPKESKKHKKKNDKDAPPEPAVSNTTALPDLTPPTTMTQGWIVPGQLYQVTTDAAFAN